MEYLILIILAIGISILDDRFGGKKKVPPPTVPQEVPRPRRRTKKMQTQERFEIPPMRGVPGQAEITVRLRCCAHRNCGRKGRKRGAPHSKKSVRGTAGTVLLQNRRLQIFRVHPRRRHFCRI